MDNQGNNSLSFSFTCDLNIIRAKNIEFLPRGGTVFVRYYLVSEDGKRIRLNSREIPSTSNPYWNEHVTLECRGVASLEKELSHQNRVFELRWRRKVPVISSIAGSKLLGIVKIPWKDVLGSTDPSIENWLTLSTQKYCVAVDFKPLALQLAMKVRTREKVEKPNSRSSVGSIEWKECSCTHCACSDSGMNDEIFALAVALDVM